MQIGGFQKFSLIDYPKKIAAVIFTQGCNFRCPYCHNGELVIPSLFSEPLKEDEVISFLFERKEKLQGVVVTGGEPTLQEDLTEFLQKIKDLGGKVSNSVSGATDFLILGENPGSNKITSAKKFSTKILDKKEFLKLIK